MINQKHFNYWPINGLLYQLNTYLMKNDIITKLNRKIKAIYKKSTITLNHIIDTLKKSITCMAFETLQNKQRKNQNSANTGLADYLFQTLILLKILRLHIISSLHYIINLILIMLINFYLIIYSVSGVNLNLYLKYWQIYLSVYFKINITFYAISSKLTANSFSDLFP